jgi:hypothetical protein
MEYRRSRPIFLLAFFNTRFIQSGRPVFRCSMNTVALKMARKVKVKLSRYMPCRRMGGEEV